MENPPPYNWFLKRRTIHHRLPPGILRNKSYLAIHRRQRNHLVIHSQLLDIPLNPAPGISPPVATPLSPQEDTPRSLRKDMHHLPQATHRLPLDTHRHKVRDIYNSLRQVMSATTTQQLFWQ